MGDLLTSTAASIPLPDPSASALPLSSSFSAFGRFGAGANAGAPGAGLGPRFTSPGVGCTTRFVAVQGRVFLRNSRNFLERQDRVALAITTLASTPHSKLPNSRLTARIF